MLLPDPLEPRAERRQKLVLRKTGLLRRRRQVVVDLNPIAFLEARHSVDADRDQVHRHPPQHRQGVFAGEGRTVRRETAKVAVGIADVEDRGLSVLPGGERRAVAARLAFRDRTALDDLRLDPRHLSNAFLELGPLNPTVDGDARPHEIEAVVPAETDTRGVGQRVALRLDSRCNRTKTLELHRVERTVLVGAGEVAVKRVDCETFERTDVGPAQPQPVHARIHHHVAGAAGRDLLPASDLLDGVQAGPRWQLRGGIDVGRADPMKHHQADALRQIAERLGLGPGGDEEVAAARLDQRLGRLPRTETVGVRLDCRTGGHS